ncbi:uncharacterized protein CIMG_13382 [Coccidioides immitis RS]|uniref:Uncharacterized protein n=1 Tax=Coccidioides immitis (strain RS) TaxID=246410 RepID=J3KE55_COCIM|nr:uncharacterized protein CIMG_13382 [Coccidioides immitis RS]EAS33724.3 hypothetical protein CIMG_13382 [Coccidioides immitis RS]
MCFLPLTRRKKPGRAWHLSGWLFGSGHTNRPFSAGLADLCGKEQTQEDHDWAHQVLGRGSRDHTAPMPVEEWPLVRFAAAFEGFELVGGGQDEAQDKGDPWKTRAYSVPKGYGYRDGAISGDKLNTVMETSTIAFKKIKAAEERETP